MCRHLGISGRDGLIQLRNILAKTSEHFGELLAIFTQLPKFRLIDENLQRRLVTHLDQIIEAQQEKV